MKTKLAVSIAACLLSASALATPNHYATVEPIYECYTEGDAEICIHVGDIVDVYVDTRSDAGLEGGIYIGARVNSSDIASWTGVGWMPSDQFMRIPPVATYPNLPNGFTQFRVLNGERRICDQPAFGRYNRVELAAGYGAIQPEFYPRIELHERLKHEHSILTEIDLKSSYAHMDLFGQIGDGNPKWRVVLNQNCNEE